MSFTQYRSYELIIINYVIIHQEILYLTHDLKLCLRDLREDEEDNPECD